ncbi:MAG: hypothetical protein JWN86_2946 [Planctomycetota bacterium]|nr:hypothetical protein [Planctomycetota bacterium]
MSAGASVEICKGSIVAASRKTYLILFALISSGALAFFAASPRSKSGRNPSEHVARRPAWRSSLDEAPPEVQEFLGRVFEKIPEHGAELTGYRFYDWEWDGRPTHEAMGFKAIRGLDPETLIARVMNVDSYVGNIPHVVVSRTLTDSEFKPPGKVRFYQRIRVPKIATIQHELVLVDAGTIKGYRVAYWYLLKDRTKALDAGSGARSEYNVGAWLAAPGTVGYALSSWPGREDVNALQWVSLTSGANALAKKVVEGNIDGMAAWSLKPTELGLR